MAYIDGFVAAVPTNKKNDYREMADKAASVFKKYGALRVVENWGDDVPEGKLTSFPLAVKREADETVVFSWIEWASKAARDDGMKKSMEDLNKVMDPSKMPFDGKRMIFGGFETLLSR
jgi:uncharacterized protein YbaA (DUF1428 family)